MAGSESTPKAGLCIVFFSASGLGGESVLDPNPPRRDGTFTDYIRGHLRCYHISYYANNPVKPDRGYTNLRKNPSFHLVQQDPEGIATSSEAVHDVTRARINNRIRLWVDDRQIRDWADDGLVGGPPHPGGHLGFRQMQWSDFRYRSLKVWRANPRHSND